MHFGSAYVKTKVLEIVVLDTFGVLIFFSVIIAS